jgi:B12-binding domain/radical SAM domain protein
MKKRRVFFRVFPFNILSYPVLLNAWEKNDLHKKFEIIIIDSKDTLEKIKFRNDDVLLYSFMTPFLPLVHSEIIKIKSSNTGVLIGAGGPHVTGEQELVSEIGFDLLFAGAGEDNFLKFGRDLLDNKINKGIYWCDTDRENSRLNEYLPVSQYFKTIPPLEITRGCFWKCKYCGTGSHDIHFRSLDSIALYLDHMKRNKLKRVNFISPSAFEYEAYDRKKINIGKIAEFLELTRSYEFKFIEYGIFPSEIRPDTISDDSMKILRKYVSNRAITIGAQSSLNSRLKSLGRGHSVEDIEEAVAAANAHDFLVNLDFIVGYPDETPEERALTIDFIKKLSGKYRIKTQVHFFFPLPGSSYAYRLPSFLTQSEKDKLLTLKKSGISRTGWINNERQVMGYFNWLKEYFPSYFSRYY